MQSKQFQYTTIFLLLITAFFCNNLIAQPLTAVTPVNNSYVFSNIINFKWNKFENALTYQLQISNTSNFSAIIIDTDTITNTTLDIVLPNSINPYFWRLKSNNNPDWGYTNAFTIFSPKSLDSLKLWISADSVKIKFGNIVDTLYDKSGNNGYATQLDTGKSAKIINNIINNLPSLYFDGTNDFLDGIGNVGSASEFSLYLIFKPLVFNNYGWIYRNGASTGNAFSVSTTGGNKLMFWANSASANYTPTICTYPISSFSILTIQNNNSNPVKTHFFKNSLTCGTASYNVGTNNDNKFGIGSINGSAHFFKGYIAELILFNKYHQQKPLIETYLRYKYFPDSTFSPVSLGYDIKIPYGFCDTTLYAGTRFSNFLWNTGETTENIKVNKSGKYWVRTTDVFGFQSSDTVMVSYTAIPQILSDTTLCQYDTAKINLNIGAPYIYSWSNGQTTGNFTTNTPDEFRLLITDSAGCTYRDTFNVVIDSLPTKLWLGNDTLICLGNPLGYQLLNYIPIDGLSVGYRYIWSTGDTTATTPINMTNNYALQLSNLRGCSAHDTVMVTLKGIPPTTQFVLSADSICSGDTVIFTDLTTGAISRSWTLGEGAPQTDSTFSYTYNTPGLYNISLTTSAANACPRTASKTFRVNPSPMVIFATEPACTGLPTQFTNSSLPGANDSIVQTLWSFDDPTSGVNNNSNLTNPTHQFTTAGGYNPQLIVNTRKGCSRNIIKPVSVVASAALPLPFTLVYPTPNALLADSSILFKWNESANGYYYTLQIASDISFSNIIHTSLPLKNNSLLYRFTNFDTYYWRVTAQNICGNSTQSAVQKLELFSPKQITGMQAWFNPDYGITQINGKITQWNDISGLNRTATQSDTSKSPKLITNALNGHANIQYDGNNDALIIQDSLNINSISVLSSWNGTNTVFSGYTTLISCNGPSGGQQLLISNAVSSSFYSGCYIYGSIFIDKYKTADYAPLNKYKIVGGFKSIPKSYSGTKTLRIGHDLTYSPWKGYIPEIILFNNPAMDSTTLAKLTDYFYAKYAPPVSLGYDIKIPYKLCDTVISAQANHFTNYLWSTGDTTPSIQVSRSGSYWVRTTNIFGQLSSDTVEVYFAAHRTLPDTTICFGDTYQYNWTPLTNYTLNWSNGNSGSLFTETEAGSYHFTLTDTLGCTYKDTFNLFVDSLVLRMSLGNDTSYCSGNTLNYQLDNYSLTNPQFLWSTGSTSATALVDSTHAYWVQITNPRGCVARDTILINVRGKAPVVSFTAPGKCFGETTEMSDLSYCIDESNLVSWQWNFGDGQTASTQNPTHQYTSSGIYPITLSVTSDSLCSNSIIIPTVVYSLPVADFTPLMGCNNTPIQFTDQSNSLDGYTLENWNWNFGDIQSGGNNTSNSQTPAHQFDTAGAYSIKLKVTSNVGCSDSIYKTMAIRQAPQANFVYSNTCEGQTTWFSDSTVVDSWNNIISRTWIFDDNFTSNQGTVSRTYPESGNYGVTYIVTSINGCTDTIQKEVSVYTNPIANFTANTFCKNEPVLLESSSTIENDILSVIKWKVGDTHFFEGSPVTFMLDSAKSYPVQLIVSSAHLCTDTIRKNIEIKPIPEAMFSFIYDQTVIGNTIQFTNTTQGDNTYQWFSDDILFSTENNPSYNFGDAGVYEVNLIAKNNLSCSDSTSTTISVVNPSMDIAISNLLISSTGNYQQATVTLLNMSNRNITDLWITLQVNDQQIRERWSGILRSGEVISYPFKSQLYISSAETIDYGCARVSSSLFSEEINLQNNETCISFGETFKVVKLYPNPASENLNLWISSPYESSATLNILSTKGEKIQTWNQSLIKGITQIKIPTTSLASGLFLLEIEFYNKTEHIKFNVIR